MWNINAPQGRIPCAIFTQFAKICTSFQDALAVKVSLDLLQGLWSYGGFNLTGSGYPHIFSAPWRRNYASDTQNSKKSRYLGRSSSDFDKIWHSDEILKIQAVNCGAST